MSKRKRKTDEDLEWESDAFDIDDSPVEDSGTSLSTRIGSGAPSLTADQVASVRFHTTRPGYSFEQVEIFVEQVKDTLSALEAALYEKDVELYEAREDQGDLQDRISTLAATIEVFRAKGDPVRSSDGSYMTESQAGQYSAAQTAEMQQAIEALNRDLALAEEERANLRANIADLTSALAAAEAQRAEAEAAEDELRQYVDGVLGPWIAAAQAREEEPQAMPQQVVETVTLPQEPALAPLAPVATQWPSEDVAEQPVPLPEATPLGHVESLPPAPQPLAPVSHGDDGLLLGGDDWDDAPSVGDALAAATPEGSIPEPTDQHEETAEDEKDDDNETENEMVAAPSEPVPPILPPLPPPPQRARAKLIDAPELRGN